MEHAVTGKSSTMEFPAVTARPEVFCSAAIDQICTFFLIQQ